MSPLIAQLLAHPLYSTGQPQAPQNPMLGLTPGIAQLAQMLKQSADKPAAPAAPAPTAPGYLAVNPV